MRPERLKVIKDKLARRELMRSNEIFDFLRDDAAELVAEVERLTAIEEAAGAVVTASASSLAAPWLQQRITALATLMGKWLPT